MEIEDRTARRDRTLLIVDPKETDVAVYMRALKDTPIEVAAVHTSAEAIEYVRLYRPRFVLVELDIDGECGLELIRPLLHIVPAIAITIVAAEKRASASLYFDVVRRGAYFLVHRPINASDIPRFFDALDEGHGHPGNILKRQWAD